MRRNVLALAAFAVLCISFVAPLAAAAAPVQTGVLANPVPVQATPPPVVHVVMFYLDTCPHCRHVLDVVLPPLREQYGEQLEILLIQVQTNEDWERLDRTAQALGIPWEQASVPLLIIGDRVLIGAEQIPAELPGLIEQYLAAGGVDYPDVPTLTDLYPGAAPVDAGATPPATQPAANGFTLAYLVLAGMGGALVYSGVRVTRPTPPAATHSTTGFADAAVLLLALVGLGVAGYLTYVETQAVPAVCGPVGNCNAVQSSPYARLFGLVPVALLGAASYVAILALWLWQRLRHDWLARLVPLAIFALALVGTLFSVYLTVLEPIVIHAVCAWCLSSSVIITLILLLSLEPARRAWPARLAGEARI
jgi:uncharacterized membrane protein